jgi:Dynein light chain type 1
MSDELGNGENTKPLQEISKYSVISSSPESDEWVTKFATLVTESFKKAASRRGIAELIKLQLDAEVGPWQVVVGKQFAVDCQPDNDRHVMIEMNGHSILAYKTKLVEYIFLRSIFTRIPLWLIQTL